jgi:hypothetical protein
VSQEVHDGEIVQLTTRVGAVEQARATDRADVDNKIDDLRTELQQQVLSLTREGWHYIAGGAAVSAAGIVISHFA